MFTARREACTLLDRGALVGIRRAPIGNDELPELRLAFERASSAHPSGLVMLLAVRLSPEFPLAPGFDHNLRELADLLRLIDRVLVATAVVIEFGGIRASAMRAATQVVRALARSRGEMALFSRFFEAVDWLLPRARAVGAPDDVPTYLRLYRAADEVLAEA